MLDFLTKDRQIALHPFNTNDTSNNFIASLFCAISLLIGFLISSSTISAIVLVVALFGTVIVLRPVIGLYLMVFFIPLEAIVILAESLTAIKLIGWVVLVGWLLNIALTKKRIIFPREGWYLFAFITWGILSMYWAIDANAVIQRIPVFIQLLGFYVLVVNLVDSKERILHLFGALLIGCMVASGLTFFYFREAYFVGEIQGGRIGVGSVNHFPATLLLVVPFLFLHIIFAASNLLRFCSLGAAGVILIAFFAGMSRGAVLGLIVILMVMLIKYKKYILRLFVWIPIAILMGIYFMPEQFWLRMFSGFTLEDRGAGRLDIWLVGWNIITHNPFLGVGLDSFIIAFDAYRTMTSDLARVFTYGRSAHSIYIGTVGELGIVGGALLLMVIVSHLRKGSYAVRYFKAMKDQSGEIIAMSTILSFLGLLAVGITSDILYRKYFWLSLALVVVINRLTWDARTVENKEIVNHLRLKDS